MEFNSIGITVFCIIYIVYAILGFYNLVSEQKVIFLEKSGFFWANVAWIIYSSGVSFIFLYEQYFISHHLKLIENIWMLVCLLNTIKYLFLAVSLKTSGK